jgi:hypothetical protein
MKQEIMMDDGCDSRQDKTRKQNKKDMLQMTGIEKGDTGSNKGS